jgi:hypothetical protein
MGSACEYVLLNKCILHYQKHQYCQYDLNINLFTCLATNRLLMMFPLPMSSIFYVYDKIIYI